MILNLLFYTVLIVIAFYVVKPQRARVNNAAVKKKTKSVSFYEILLLALLFTLYNVFVTVQGIKADNIEGDRLHYSLNFAGVTQAGTLGLQLLIDFIRSFSDHSSVMFFGTTFVCVVITLIAYRKSDEALPAAILFLVLTQWVFSTIVNLKQCYSSAFAALFFVYALKKPNLKNSLFSFLFIFLSALFHQSGYILIPVYFVIRFFKTYNGSIILLVLCLITFLFFNPLVLFVAKTIEPILPTLANKINSYFLYNEVESEGMLSFIKGLPFYYITFIGFIRHNSLSKKINHYYTYLNISIIASLVYLLSIYNGWLFRLIYLFYFPVAIFFGRILKQSKISNVDLYYVDSIIVFGGLAVVLYRYIILMYVNYGGFAGIF